MKSLLICLTLIAIACGNNDSSNKVKMSYLSNIERTVFFVTQIVFQKFREKGNDDVEFEKFHTCLNRQSFYPSNFAWVTVESFEENLKSACSSKAEILTCIDELADAHKKYLKPNETVLLDTYLSIMKTVGDYACEDNGAKIITMRKDENVNCLVTTYAVIDC